MGGLILLVAVAGNEETNCTQTPADPDVVCAAASDCEGLPHDLCLDGGWQCVDGACKYTCEPVQLGCHSDADCPEGKHCSVSDGDCGTDPNCPMCDVCYGECVPDPQPECETDKDCKEYEYCDFVVYYGTMDCCPPGTFCDAGIPPCEEGVCRLKAGFCWTDDDCGLGEKCEGVLMTNCGDPTDPESNCIDGDWPGNCVQSEPECMSDDDCPPGFVCVVETWCPPCYDEDPPCLAPCYAEGHCEPAPEDKCFDDSDCADGEYCDFSGSLGDCCMPGEFCLAIYPPCEGVCKDKNLPPGECWDDGDCKAGEHCEGAIICPPGAYCFAPDIPGKCVPDDPQECVAIEPGSHGICGMLLGVIFDGEKCVYESGCGCWPDCGNIFDSFEACEKACQPAPPPDDCMSNEDCPSGEYCDLMNSQTTICIKCDPNAIDCIPGCFPVGQCESLPEGVCVKDADCKPWQQCAFIYPCPLCLNCPCFGVCQDMLD